MAGREGTVKVVELPYGKKEFAATVVVPTGKLTVAEVAATFEGGAGVWEEWVEGMSLRRLQELAMPRFKLEFGAQSLKANLAKLGVRAAFEGDAREPQFLRMTADRDAYLDDVLHKATLECTEEGTIATAATAGIMMTRSMPRERPSVVLDRPFLFVIRNTVSGSILFVAKVDNPISP